MESFRRSILTDHAECEGVILRTRWGQLLHIRRGRSVSRSVTAVSPSIMAQPINMPFGLRTRVDPMYHVLLFSVSVFAHHHNAAVS